VPDGNNAWAVRAAGSEKRTFKGLTQKSALRIAKNIARNQEASVVVHTSDGRISYIISKEEL